MKRTRESSIQYEIKDEYVVLNYNGKQYAWFAPMRAILEAFLNHESYDYSIVHNNNGQAMFNVEDLRDNKDVFRQEVNPLKYKDVDEWAKDE